MSFVQIPISYNETNPNLGIEFTLLDGSKENYDIIHSFEETEDKYVIDNSSYTYTIYKKDIIEPVVFYELNIECWHCNNLCLYSERVTASGVYEKGTEKEFGRTRDFCCDECVEKYSKENDFSI